MKLASSLLSPTPPLLISHSDLQTKQAYSLWSKISLNKMSELQMKKATSLTLGRGVHHTVARCGTHRCRSHSRGPRSAGCSCTCSPCRPRAVCSARRDGTAGRSTATACRRYTRLWDKHGISEGKHDASGKNMASWRQTRCELEKWQNYDTSEKSMASSYDLLGERFLVIYRKFMSAYS